MLQKKLEQLTALLYSMQSVAKSITDEELGSAVAYRGYLLDDMQALRCHILQSTPSGIRHKVQNTTIKVVIED